eukprot:2708114-Pyramimonas_sp.AAC.1
MWTESHASNPKSWHDSKGPLARACLAARRAGWDAPRPLKWVDHSGLTADTGQLTPGLLCDLLEAGLQRQHEQALARKLGAERKYCATFDLVRDSICSGRSKTMARYQKFLVRCCACDALWTEERARLAGYETTGRC